MNNVIAFNPREHIKTEVAFVKLLEAHCHQEGTVKPLSSTLFDRIERLKIKANEAKQRREQAIFEEVILLEG